jgi:hypothetical protein
MAPNPGPKAARLTVKAHPSSRITLANGEALDILCCSLVVRVCGLDVLCVLDEGCVLDGFIFSWCYNGNEVEWRNDCGVNRLMKIFRLCL